MNLQWDKIIDVAARSPLGVFCLIVLVLAFLAHSLFRRAPVRVRLRVLVMMMAADAVFVAVLASKVPTAALAGQQPPSAANAPASTDAAPPGAF